MEQVAWLAGPRPVHIVRYLAAEPVGAVVLAPPFAEELKAANRALVELARALAAGGYSVLRLDLTGTGDSAGDLATATLDLWRADLRAALAEAATLHPRVTLIGLRFGAALAVEVAREASPPLAGLILLEPITSGATYMRQNRQRSRLRAELTAGEATGASSGDDPWPAFDFDGFAVSAELHREMAAIELADGALPAVERALILQISGSSRLKRPFEELRAAWTGGPAVELANVAVEPFWSSIGLVDTAPVRERVLAWLGRPAVDPPAVADLQGAGEPVAIDEGVTAEPWVWPSGEQHLVGLLYRPAAGPVTRVVVLLHGWSGYRIGPGRLLTNAARRLARAGYAALSFDFRGRGESDWTVGQASLNSMIRDAQRAIPAVCAATGAERVTLLGLCSGSEVALGASLSDPRVDSLVLWSAPIFSGEFDLARRARRSKVALAGYVRKLFLKETWGKLLGGRINWRMVGRAVAGGRSAEDRAVADKAPDTATQMAAFAAFGGRLLLIYGGQDPETEPSREFYRSFLERTGQPHTFLDIAGANHNFYSLAWHDEVIDGTLAWLAGGDE